MVFKLLISLSVIVYVGKGMWVRSLRPCTHQVPTLCLFLLLLFFLTLWCISGSVFGFSFGFFLYFEHACARLCYLYGSFWIKLALDKFNRNASHSIGSQVVTWLCKKKKCFTATLNFGQLWHLNFNQIKSAPTADLQPTGRISSALWPPQLI